MKKATAVFLALVLGIATLGLANETADLSFEQVVSGPATGLDRSARSHLDEIIYYESWADGDFADWTPIDLTAAPSAWHLDEYEAYEGTGTSWWMADPTVGATGGYLDDWYMTLNSPAVQLGAAPSLSFYHRYSCEDPGGEPDPYDGWDGMNIRISTDGGATWEVITAVTPAYTVSSSYAFGFQHGEGPNVPQWCNTSDGLVRHEVTADLSAWANENAIIRWAFASDPAYNTQNDNAMFGWMVDAIQIFSDGETVVYETDAEAVDDMVAGTNRPVGGNLWRIADDPTAPTEPHVVVCNNEGTELYNPDMNTVFMSPVIDIAGLETGLLFADFQIRGDVYCMDGEFPDCDYFGVQVSMDEGASWCYVSNPTCDPNGQNFVYTGLPEGWQGFNESYSTPIDLTEYLTLPDPPQSLKFQFTLETNADQNLGVGPMFDDFLVEFQTGFPNDMSCYSVQVRYPTMINRTINVQAYFENVGSETQAQVIAFYRVTGSTPRRFLPNIGQQGIDFGERESRTGTVTIDAAGAHEIMAWSALGSDQDQSNDSAATPPQGDGFTFGIDVLGEGEALELGYDNRHIQLRYPYDTGDGPLVHFTPADDDVNDELMNMTGLSAKFDAGQANEGLGDLPVGLHVYAGGETPGAELYNAEFIVPMSLTGTDNWVNVDLSGVSELEGISGDFWVWLETVSEVSGTGGIYPQVLGNNPEEWDDADHFYDWDGSGDPDQRGAFFIIHAHVEEVTAVGDAETTLPLNWNLSQNYPNPFNPTTEIQYTVPKLADLTLRVYNVLGQEVATLVSGSMEAGVHTVTFNSEGLSSGVYVYRLESAGFSQTRKMLLMK